MQLIHFLTSEPAPKTLKRHVMHSQVHRGISLIVLPLLSERAGERLLFIYNGKPLRACERLLGVVSLPEKTVCSDRKESLSQS